MMDRRRWALHYAWCACVSAALAKMYADQGRWFAAVLWGVSIVVWIATAIVTARVPR